MKFQNETEGDLVATSFYTLGYSDVHFFFFLRTFCFIFIFIEGTAFGIGSSLGY